MLALDSETLGLDPDHGCRPFFVTCCDSDGTQKFWEWSVDPLTRTVDVRPEDVKEIKNLLAAVAGWCDGSFDAEITERHKLVLQNGKFDATALKTIGIDLPFHAMHDTLIASHLLCTNKPHDLTSLGLQYLDYDISPLEKNLEAAVKKARNYCGHHLKDWRIARDEDPMLPSGGGWGADMWLPRALVKYWWEQSECHARWQDVQDARVVIPHYANKTHVKDRLEKLENAGEWLALVPGWEYRPPEVFDGDHEWWTVLRDYSNADSGLTVALFPVMKQLLVEQDLWEIYLESMKLPHVAHRMERRGITYSGARVSKLKTDYAEKSYTAGQVCVNIAKGYGYDLELPKNGRNAKLNEFVFDVMRLPTVATTATGAPSMNKDVLEHWELTLPANTKELLFAKRLRGKRSLDTALGYIDSYEKFAVPIDDLSRHTDYVKKYDDYEAEIALHDHLLEKGHEGWWVLHPNLNITGTKTLRGSMKNPNGQQISKKENFNLRFLFGPRPDREYWSFDYSNIERRIPAYIAGETDIIELFEQPDKGPYYGSEHLLVAHILHKQKFEQCVGKDGRVDGRVFKKLYASTLYQYTKNFNFAVQYGCQRAKGDATAHRAGAYDLVKSRFSKQEALNQRCINMANRLGYVETLPDKTVNPRRGYPIRCSKADWGGVSPTEPLCYFSSGSAMWCTRTAMPRCQRQLDEWRNRDGFDGYLVLQVHDEVIFDFPKAVHPHQDFKASNLWRAKALQDLMAQSGRNFVQPVPTPTNCEYIEDNWAEGVTCA